MKARMGFILSLLVVLCTLQAWAAELLIEDFESINFLSVGGERFSPESKVEVVGEQVKVGTSAVKFSYVFGAQGSPRYVEMFINREIPVNFGRVSVWVWGNGSGNPLRARIYDATGEIFQVTIGDLNWVGWELKEFELKAYPGSWSGNHDGKLDLPLKRISLLVDSLAGSQTPGPIYSDEMRIIAQAGQIRGTVTDKLGDPLREAKVYVEAQPELCGITGDNGSFNLWIEPGIYNLVANIKGYETLKKTNVQVNEDSVTNLDFILNLAPDYGVFSDKAQDQEDGLYLLSGGDGWGGRSEEVGSKRAIVTDKSKRQEFFYFKVDDGYIFGEQNEVYVSFDYFDKGHGIIALTYDGTANNFSVTGVVERKDTNLWKTATFHLKDAHFANRQNGGADFRIGVFAPGYPLGDDIYLGKVTVVKSGKIIELVATPQAFSPRAGGVVTVSYRLSSAGVVSCWVEDRNGNLIATIAEGREETIADTFTWAGRSDQGELVPSGAYYIKLAASGFVWKEAGAMTVAVEVDNEPPPSPQITEPLGTLTINESQVVIVGQASPGAIVRAYIGNILAAEVQADARGVCRVKVEGLVLGENDLYLTEFDDAGNESEPSSALRVRFDSQHIASQLTVSSPEFNPEFGTEVRFFLATEREVQVRVLDGRGRSLGEILQPSLKSGEVSFHWHGQVGGKVLNDGVYWLELSAGSVLGKCTVVVDSTEPRPAYLLLPGGRVSQGQVRFVWEGAPDVSWYRLKIWHQGESEYALTYEVLTTSFQLTDPLKKGNWFWQVEAFDGAGNRSSSAIGSFSLEPNLAQALELSNLKGGPNPFAPNGNGLFESYQVSYSLSQPATVRVAIYNLAGKEVYRSEGIPQGVGDHYFVWDGRDNQGRRVARGPYLLAIFAENDQNKAPARGRLLVSVMY